MTEISYIEQNGEQINLKDFFEYVVKPYIKKEIEAHKKN
jgi:hypothetical protein